MAVAWKITPAQRAANRPKQFRGAKWLREADYLTEADREVVLRKMDECRELCRRQGWTALVSTVGCRAPAYTGEPHPIAAITYGPGGSSLYGFAYRD